MPALGLTLPVYEGQVDFVANIHVDHRVANIVDAPTQDAIELGLEVRYQACDAETCHIPQRENLTLTIPIARHVGNTLAGELAGTVTTTMDSRRYLLRMVWRGLHQSPLRGGAYLLGLLRDIRRGPTARRAPARAER